MHFLKKVQMSKAKSPKQKSRLSYLPPTPPRLFLGLVFLIFGLAIIFSNNRVHSAETPVNTEPIKIQGFQEKKETTGEIPIQIVIPQAGIDIQVKRSEIVNGYWEVFEESAGWGVESGYPGSPGNQVIFAHARERLFLDLTKAKIGTNIYVMTGENWYKYETKEIKEVFPDQVEIVAPTEDETLTLYTCSGYKDQKRLVLVAKRV